jgi:hypothetical protein
MITWDTVAVWTLQGIGAIGAIWGLFASETSQKIEGTGRRRLTSRGWFALTGVILGLCGFALNQYKEKVRSERERDRIAADQQRAKDIESNTKLQIRLSEKEAELAGARAQAAKSQLALVELSQDQIAKSQGSLILSQRSQIDFLTGLAMVQQQLSGIELFWQEQPELRDRISRHVRAVMKEWKIEERGKDVYFEPCFSHGALTMTRRPNYTWQVACIISRPGGQLPVTFEVATGDNRANVIDAFLDDLLSPDFIIENSRGDTLVESNVGARPVRIQREGDSYKIQFEVPRTRFSTLADRSISIRMDTTDLGPLRKWIRIRSRDPLARFDTQWNTDWQLRKIGTTVVQASADSDPEPIDIKAAVTPVRGFRVSFDPLLRPASANGRRNGLPTAEAPARRARPDRS